MSVPARPPTQCSPVVVALVLLVVGVVGGTTPVAGATADPADSPGSASVPVEPSPGDDATGTENRTLVVAAADTGDRLFAVPVRDGEEIVLRYTHSVEKTPVEDVYVANGTDLRMDRTVFRSFGAGLPSDADMNRTDDGYVVPVDRSFDRVYVATGEIAGHVLVVGDRCYDLVDRSGGSTVVLTVENRSAGAPPPTAGEPIDPLDPPDPPDRHDVDGGMR